MTKKLRKDARSIFQAALVAADPRQAVLRSLRVEDGVLIAAGRRYPLREVDRIVVLGAGKASAAMAQAVEKLLGKRIDSGWVNVKYGHVAPVRRVRLHECAHPVPDEAGVKGAQVMAAMAQAAGPRDLVITLISGGASALSPAPAEGITLAEKQEVTRLLLACGATIHEINAVRKHISTLKGGQLARLCQPARVLSLLLSDVIGDDLDVIGSGPTAPDSSTFQTALAILEKYGITASTPAPILNRLRRGAAGEWEETPKADNSLFRRVQNLVIGSNRLAVDAAAAKAKALGYRPMVLSTFVEGEAREVGRLHACIAKEIVAAGRPVKVPACVISGGETTVTLRGKGKGGRSQELALAAAIHLKGLPNAVVLSGGTDGTDGPTNAAGAIADGDTLRRAEALGLSAAEHLANNDSYPFFERLGDLLITGPTGTNVMDVNLILVGGR